MQFQHIAQAIAYAKETGDMAALYEYTNTRTHDAAKRLMPALSNPMTGDDKYFLAAFGQALLDVSKASMSQQERDLIENIYSSIQITVVKASIPNIETGEEL